MPNAQLIVENGRMAGRHYTLEEGRSVTIGRSVQSDFQISDQGVSRLHCRVDNKPVGVMMTDLGSSNGTRVDDTIYESKILENGERIFCGTTAIRISLGEGKRNSVRRRAAGNTSLELVTGVNDSADALRKTYLPGAALFDPKTGGDAELETSRRRLNAICGLGATIHGQSNLDSILEAAASTILQISGADRSAILMKDEATGEVLPVASKVLNEQEEDHAFRVSSTIVGEVMGEGLSVTTSDAATDERFQSGASIVLENIHSVMCVPLRTREKIIGAMYVDSTSLSANFGEEDLALLAAIGNQTGVAIERARLVRDLEYLFVGAMHAIIASLEAKDAYTRGHSERVTAYALLIADELGVDDATRRVVELAGLLHDVGKIGVPEAVLCKPGRLTDEEFALIREHPALGAKILEKMPEMERLVDMQAIVTTVRHHHEKFSGGGYPDGLTGDAIPLCSRILAAADTYDAIAGDRVYRKGRGPQKALEIIREVSGTQLDPQIVDAIGAVYDKNLLDHPEKVEGRFQIHQLNIRLADESETTSP